MSDLSVHSYLDSKNYKKFLLQTSFREIINSKSNNKNIYFKYYSKGQLKTVSSFSDYYLTVLKFVSYFKNKLKIKAGDKVVIQLQNSDYTLWVYGALLYLGAVLVPVNPDESEDEVERIKKITNAVELLNLNKVEGIDKIELDEIVNANENETISLDSPAAIFFTSGTTGAGKGAVLSVGNLLINSLATQSLHSMNNESVHGCVLPLFHVNAFSFSFVSTLFSNSRLILQDSFFQPTFWKIVLQEEIQIVSLVPSVIKLLLLDKHAKVISNKLSFIRYFVSAAAALSQQSANDFYEKMGIRIIQAYGLSETVNFSLTVPVKLNLTEYKEHFLDQAKLSVGTAVFGNEVSLMRQDGTLCNEENIEAEIVVRGWNVMQGYLNDPIATAQAFLHGWFHTGDLGCYRKIKGEKWFYITGRIKEVVKRNGELISLQQLDFIIQKIKGLEDSATFSFEDVNQSEEIGLCVAAGSAVFNKSELVFTACREVLPNFKMPKAVFFMDAIPKTPTGKIKRNKIAKAYVEAALSNLDSKKLQSESTEI